MRERRNERKRQGTRKRERKQEGRLTKRNERDKEIIHVANSLDLSR
jgi:hypothetical protein